MKLAPLQKHGPNGGGYFIAFIAIFVGERVQYFCVVLD